MTKDNMMVKRILRTAKMTSIVLAIILGLIVFLPILACLILVIILETRYSPKDYIPLSTNNVVATQHEYSASFIPKRKGEHSLAFNFENPKYIAKTNLNFVIYSIIKLRYPDGSVEEFLRKDEMNGSHYISYSFYGFAPFYVRKVKRSKPCVGEFSVRIEGDISPIACDKIQSFIVSKFSEHW